MTNQMCMHHAKSMCAMDGVVVIAVLGLNFAFFSEFR